MFGRVNDRLLCWQARRATDERGVTLIEYILIAALIAVVSIAIMTTAGTSIKDLWQYISDQISGAKPAGA